jgi:hypothetical protein
MLRGRTVRTAALLGCLALFGAGAAARADDPPPPPFHPFSPLVGRFEVGRTVRMPGALIVTLRLAESLHPRVDAQVGLRGAEIDVMDLPAPAGEFYVRVSNRGPKPLEIPAGETLLTPSGPSRTVDRAVWVGPGTAAFLPLAQASLPAPNGPYVTRGLGLTPRELELLASGPWGERVRARNALLGVAGPRVDDASAAYLTDAFQQGMARFAAGLGAIGNHPAEVGVVVFDERGAAHVRVETDPARFACAWWSLRAGIALDALVAEAEKRAPFPTDDAAVHAQATSLLAALLEAPRRRPGLGGLDEYRWVLPDGRGTWSGLARDGEPLSLVFLHGPKPPPAQPPPPTPPPVQPPDPPKPPPSNEQIERKPRPTPLEERLKDRREPGQGGVR